MRGEEDDDIDDGEEANRVRRGMTGCRNGVMMGRRGRIKRSGTLPRCGTGERRGEF